MTPPLPSADEGAHLVHQGGHVHLTDRRSVVGAAVSLRHVAQGAGGRQVGHRGDGLSFLLGQAAEVVGDADEGIFLHEGRSSAKQILGRSFGQFS